MYMDSEIVVGYGRFRDNEFVRLVSVNATNTEAEFMAFFKKMEAYVEDSASVMSI